MLQFIDGVFNPQNNTCRKDDWKGYLKVSDMTPKDPDRFLKLGMRVDVNS
jgi:hypothetical protein